MKILCESQVAFELNLEVKCWSVRAWCQNPRLNWHVMKNNSNWCKHFFVNLKKHDETLRKSGRENMLCKSFYTKLAPLHKRIWFRLFKFIWPTAVSLQMELFFFISWVYIALSKSTSQSKGKGESKKGCDLGQKIISI